MKRLYDFYLAHPRLIGALYCIVPVSLGFAILFAANPFRGVYVLRLILSLALGAPLAAWLNEFGLRLWLLKHASPAGPASVLDGVLIGAAVGAGAALVPPLTTLLASHHLEDAKTIIIVCWVAALLVGGIIGGSLAVIGIKFATRQA